MILPRSRAALRLCATLVLGGTLGCASSTEPIFIPNLGWIEVSEDSVTLPAAPNLFVDGFREVTAIVYDTLGNVLTDVAPTWSSSNPSVAKVTADGIITGEAPGIATITAAVGRQAAATVAVTVVEQPDTIVVVAHRGFPKLFPENTIVAIDGAFANQADAVEVDVRWTQDGGMVLMHDKTVDRTTNGSGAVSDLTLAQIQQLDACARFWPARAPCPVPTLRSALEAARGRGRLVLDLSDPQPTQALAALLAEIDDAGMRHDVVIISFYYQVLQNIRRLDPVIPLGYLTTRLPYMPDVVALGRTATMPDQAVLLGNPQQGRAFVDYASAGRIALGTWVAAGMADAQSLVALGVRHITSDVPLDKQQLQP